MSKMLTAVARMLRTDGMRDLTPRAKTIFKRRANRSERRASFGMEEHGSEADDVEPPHPDDETCVFCRSVHPSHRMVWVKRRELGPCDCCDHWSWESYCQDCVSLS